jgi:hypothetical protein
VWSFPREGRCLGWLGVSTSQGGKPTHLLTLRVGRGQALATEEGDDEATGVGMDRSSTCLPGSAACLDRLDLTTSKGGVMCLVIFAVAYSMVMLEDQYVPLPHAPHTLRTEIDANRTNRDSGGR